jgi:hypothetical protein
MSSSDFDWVDHVDWSDLSGAPTEMATKEKTGKTGRGRTAKADSERLAKALHAALTDIGVAEDPAHKTRQDWLIGKRNEMRLENPDDRTILRVLKGESSAANDTIEFFAKVFGNRAYGWKKIAPTESKLSKATAMASEALNSSDQDMIEKFRQVALGNREDRIAFSFLLDVWKYL